MRLPGIQFKITGFTVVIAACLLASSQTVAEPPAVRFVYDGMPSGVRNYDAFVELWDDFLYWQDPANAGKEKSLVDVAGLETDVYPDYGALAITARLRRLQEFQ